MLFDKVVFLYGSGVIPRRFVEIRKALKDMIMNSFFEEEHMKRFMDDNINNTVGDIIIHETLHMLFFEKAIHYHVLQRLSDLYKASRNNTRTVQEYYLVEEH